MNTVGNLIALRDTVTSLSFVIGDYYDEGSKWDQNKLYCIINMNTKTVDLSR